MAIKIIRTGRVPGSRTMDGVCNYCHTVVECLESDAHDLDPKSKDAKEVACPVCGRDITVRIKEDRPDYNYEDYRKWRGY